MKSHPESVAVSSTAAYKGLGTAKTWNTLAAGRHQFSVQSRLTVLSTKQSQEMMLWLQKMTHRLLSTYPAQRQQYHRRVVNTNQSSTEVTSVMQTPVEVQSSPVPVASSSTRCSVSNQDLKLHINSEILLQRFSKGSSRAVFSWQRSLMLLTKMCT
ncbi:uncharacterized protein LOC144595552 [Rhinoraja longicauda]